MTTDATPWERFGWVMAAIWLVFLGFPIYFVLREPLLGRVSGLVVIAVFAAVYLYSFIAFPRTHPPDARRRNVLILLLALTGVLGLIITINALSLAPFIVAYSVYHRPLRQAIWLTAALTLVFVVLVTVWGWWPEMAPLGIGILLAGFGTAVPRWIDDREAHHKDLRREYELVSTRERMARDVHDVLGHSLTVITVKSELAERLITAEPQAAARELAEIRALSREALAEIRTTISGRRRASLVEELARGEAALGTAGIGFSLEGDPEGLTPERSLVAAWVVREALTNVIRHSGATRCRVEIAPDRIVITDDGRGTARPDEAVGSDGGTGIAGMRERARAAGGSFRVGMFDGTDSADGTGGTRVEVAW